MLVPPRDVVQAMAGACCHGSPQAHGVFFARDRWPCIYAGGCSRNNATSGGLRMNSYWGMVFGLIGILLAMASMVYSRRNNGNR
jgi:hypothetical protein